MSRFAASTRVPVVALTCGPRVGLDDAQRALVDEFDELYPFEKLSVLRSAFRAGRLDVVGADLFALAQKRAAVADVALEQ